MSVTNVRRFVEQVKHLPHVHKRLPDFAIDRAKEIQGHGDLDHVGVHKNEIADGQLACLYAECGEEHDRHQPGGDQNRLPEIQKGQRVACLQRCSLIAGHRLVIAFGFPACGPEIFYGFKIQEAVDRLLIGVGVLFIHLPAKFDAPFCDREGEPDIDRDGGKDDADITPVLKLPENGAANQDQFKHQRPGGEHQIAKQEFNTLHTTLDDPAQTARLARDVIPQGQPVDMFKSVEGEAPQRALCNLCEQGVADLLKTVCRDAGHAIGNCQADGAKSEVRHTASRQIVNSPCLQDRGDDRNEFGCHQRQKGQHNTGAKVKITNRPEERGDAFHRTHGSPAFALLP